MTLASLTSCPKIRDATSLTTCFWSAPDSPPHRRGRAHTHKIAGGDRVLHTSDEHGDIGALPPPVGVEFVEDEEAQIVRRFHQPVFGRTGENQFQHHIVGEQDVRWVLQNLGACLCVFLASIAPECYRGLAGLLRIQELF